MNFNHHLSPPPAPPQEQTRPAEEVAQEKSRPEPEEKRKGGLFRFVLILAGTAVFLTLLGILGWMGLSHNAHERAQTALAVQQGAVTVQVVKPSLTPSVFDISLPGSG